MGAADADDPSTGAAADAFARLGHEVRLDIIRALGSPEVPGRMPRLGFAELRDRVGVGNSSRFNYHLGELVGHYVEADDEGYVLTYPGLLVWTAVNKGVYADPGAVTVDPFPLDAPCANCDGTLTARYEGGGCEVACADCDAFLFRRPLPPATVESADREAFLDAAGRRYLQEVSLRREGFCPVCVRQVTPDLVAPDEAAVDRDARDLAVQAVHDCSHCTVFSFNTVGEYVLSHPTVRGFLRERDRNPGRPWAQPFAVVDDATIVRSRDPWTVEVTVAADGDELTATVDGSASVHVGESADV